MYFPLKIGKDLKLKLRFLFKINQNYFSKEIKKCDFTRNQNKYFGELNKLSQKS